MFLAGVPNKICGIFCPSLQKTDKNIMGIKVSIK
jgi:hypothetical protein